MGYRHTKNDILTGALATALDEGLSTLTYGRVAKRLGINDRTVVYYFPTKDELLTEVVMSMGVQLQETLSAAFSGAPGNNFAVTSAELGRNFGVVGAGVTAQLSPLVNLYLDYDYTFSSSLEAHAGSGGLEFLW